MGGRILKLAYLLREHRIGEWSLERWGVTLAWAAAALLLLLWWLRGAPALPPWHWAVLVLLLAIGVALLLLRAGGALASYVVFSPEADLAPPPGEALQPADKVLVHATGHFEVEGRQGFFANLLAYWRTFASREHAVLAIAHASSLLGLARRPVEKVGMWYVFFRPEVIEAVTPGRLAFGARVSPGLRIVYRYTPPVAEDGKRRARPREVRRTLYLACEDEAARRRIWADLLAG